MTPLSSRLRLGGKPAVGRTLVPAGRASPVVNQPVEPATNSHPFLIDYMQPWMTITRKKNPKYRSGKQLGTAPSDRPEGRATDSPAGKRFGLVWVSRDS